MTWQLNNNLDRGALINMTTPVPWDEKWEEDCFRGSGEDRARWGRPQEGTAPTYTRSAGRSLPPGVALPVSIPPESGPP